MVTESGTIRLIGYDFLLVFYSSFVSIRRSIFFIDIGLVLRVILKPGLGVT